MNKTIKKIIAREGLIILKIAVAVTILLWLVDWLFFNLFGKEFSELFVIIEFHAPTNYFVEVIHLSVFIYVISGLIRFILRAIRTLKER